MNNLIKIRDVSLKYDISARTLRYYEDTGLINSSRSDEYAYRLYDDKALKRLEQILILRKLNISVRDIKRIFNTNESDIVLEVLSQKITDIDNEVVLLSELRDILLNFIELIEKSDFQNESDIKKLYEKSKDIEQQIINVDYQGKTSNVQRLVAITDKLEKNPDVHIIYLPPMRVLSSFTKKSYIDDGFYYTSDVTGFFRWIDTNLPISLPGSHEVFDFQNTFIRNKYQPAAMKKVPDDFINNTPYVDYTFGGGLFAFVYTYEDESIGREHDKLKNYIDESLDYEIDYLPNGNQRHESLGEPVISQDGLRNKLAIYIPVKKRANNHTNKENFSGQIISGPNIGRIEPSADTYYDLMKKLRNKKNN